MLSLQISYRESKSTYFNGLLRHKKMSKHFYME